MNRDRLSGSSSGQALALLGLFGFLLAGMPRMRLSIGPVPLYVIDLVLLSLILAATRPAPVGSRGTLFWKLSAGYFVLLVVAEIFGALQFGAFLEPAYLVARGFLGISTVLLIPSLCSTPARLRVFFRGLAAGGLLSAILVILISLPPTRPFVMHHIFAREWLEPGYSTIIKWYGHVDTAIRGRSLIGTSTLTGGILCVVWPIALYLWREERAKSGWKVLGMAASLVIPFGAILTYSRSAVLGLVLVLLFLVTRGTKGALPALGVVAFVVIAFQVIGWDSKLFYFERLENRLKSMIDERLQDVGDRERVRSMVDPFIHVISHPRWLVIGAGRAGHKLQERGKIDAEARLYDEVGQATHSAFAMSYFTYGMLGAFCNVALLALALHYAWTMGNWLPASAGRARLLIDTVLAALIGMMPWWAFGHGSVSTPRGAIMFFSLLGVVVAVGGMFDRVRRREESAAGTRRRRPARAKSGSQVLK